MDGPILLHWKLNRARRACKEAMADLIAANKAMEEARDVVFMAEAALQSMLEKMESK